jgi:hypothetical protein
MAYDRNEPKTALITGLSVFVVVSVVLVRYGLVSYFNIMHDQETGLKIASRGSWQIAELRAQASQRLTGGAMPIDQAMAAIAQGQRPAAVSPRPAATVDQAPMTGWSQMAQPLPTELAASEPVAAPAPVVAPAPAGAPGVPAVPGAPAANVAPVAAPAVAGAVGAVAPAAAPAHGAETAGAAH